MGGQALPEQVAIDSLGGNRPLTGRDDHLTVRRRYATCGIEAGNCSLHLKVYDHLPAAIDFGAESFGQVIEVNIASSSKEGIDRQVAAIFKLHT